MALFADKMLILCFRIIYPVAMSASNGVNDSNGPTEGTKPNNSQAGGGGGGTPSTPAAVSVSGPGAPGEKKSLMTSSSQGQ